MAFALLIGATLALPVTDNDNNEETAGVTPEAPAFNYEVPTEDDFNPIDLDSEERKLTELQPPAVDSYVPFRVIDEAEEEEDVVEPEQKKDAQKPRKGGKKKYNPEEKWINKNAVAQDADAASSAEDTEERQYALLDFIIENLFAGIADQYNVQRRSQNDELVLNKGEYIPSAQRRIDESADDAEQVVFQVQGHQGGANSYKFGFDTGKK